MKVSLKIALFLILTISISTQVWADDSLYAKAKEIAKEFPERIEGFATDPVLLTRDENNQTQLLGLEVIYYRNYGETVTIRMRDFSGNPGLYDQEKRHSESTAPADIEVYLDYTFKYEEDESSETLSVFLDEYTILDITHINKTTDYSVVAKLLEQLDIKKLNAFEGIN